MSEIENRYKELLKNSEEKRNKRSEKKYKSSEIRIDILNIMKELKMKECIFSIVIDILKESNEKYKEIGYSSVRMSVLYKKMFKLEKREEVVYIVRL